MLETVLFCVISEFFATLHQPADAQSNATLKPFILLGCSQFDEHSSRIR